MRESVVAVSAGVGLALLLVGGLVMSIVKYTRAPNVEERPLAIPTTADLYPAARPFTKPEKCGLDDATLAKLVPGATGDLDETGCLFMIPLRTSDELGVDGSLRVVFTAGSLADAMDHYDLVTDQGRHSRHAVEGTWQPVIGLGHEAMIRYETDRTSGEASLHFRSGAVSTKVEYQMTRLKGDVEEPLGEKPTMNGALEAASEVAAAIGAKVDDPAVGARSGRPEPALTAPDPCKLVGEAALRAAGVDPASRSVMGGRMRGVTEGCSWHSVSADRYSSAGVSITSYPNGRHRDGAAEADGQFIHYYHEWRNASAAFYALRGPGRKAMADYRIDTNAPHLGKLGAARVVFTVRNLMVSVHYSGNADGKPLSEAATLKPAHAIAEAVAGKLPARVPG
ncbi:hypothetical protein [Nonomuraea sp. KM88]|uniref:hypothetical protein n=1 Tax=Nonomuraea sp. KM88 TaxID=3457427 RepID=UPI003FCC2BE9